MKFTFENDCGVSQHVLHELLIQTKLEEFHHHMHSIIAYDRNSGSYGHPFSCLLLPQDDALLYAVNECVQKVKVLDPTIMVVIGIGGSSLGTKAILQAIQGRLRGPRSQGLPIYFAETVDADRMHTIVTIVERELLLGNTIILNVVTKSGTTVETLANFYVLLDLIKRYAPDKYHSMVVVTSDKGSVLWNYGEQEGFHLLAIPSIVGGRYSVFSPVGLFPLALAGISLAEIRAGAWAMVEHCLEIDNPATISALIHYYYYCRGVRITDLFLFSVDLEALGKWYRQLMAESIGKEFDKNGKQAWVGITPTVSLGSIDLHSVAQLYLGGPRDKYTTFVTLEESDYKIIIPADAPSLSGKDFVAVMRALAQGTQNAYRNTNRPFSTVTLPKKDLFSLGQFLQWKMIEMIYLGFLLDVDCFDQPNVELYKREANRLLA